MGSGGCAEATLVITAGLASAEGARRARGLVAAGATPEQFVQAMIELAPVEMQALIQAEFEELPATLCPTVMYAWALADAAGKPFTMRSVIPDSPMEFARQQRVRIAVDVEESGVTLSLSHIPTRHAGWYQTAALAAV